MESSEQIIFENKSLDYVSAKCQHYVKFGLRLEVVTNEPTILIQKDIFCLVLNLASTPQSLITLITKEA